MRACVGKWLPGPVPVILLFTVISAIGSLVSANELSGMESARNFSMIGGLTNI